MRRSDYKGVIQRCGHHQFVIAYARITSGIHEFLRILFRNGGCSRLQNADLADLR